ncbi:maestro heat-like repeat-containing protein family member 7 [Caloenas nicobarica]|uniref:maestro heat-like repeat-containing protein family member 7 n=1 Tax=Caloenas nicobarica TaxID=187106 RepID=UPI0032B7A79B
MRGPKLTPGFEVQPDQRRVWGDDYWPGPAGRTVSATSQDAVGPFGHLGTRWLMFGQLSINTQVQDLALGLVEPHTIGLGSSSQPAQLPLKSLPTLQQINTPAQFGVTCKLSEGALDPFVQIIDKEIEQNSVKGFIEVQGPKGSSRNCRPPHWWFPARVAERTEIAWRPCVPTSLRARGAARALSRALCGRKKSLSVPDVLMAERSPNTPSLACVKPSETRAPRSSPKPEDSGEVQPLPAAAPAVSGPTSAVPRKEDPLDTIRAFLNNRPKQEDQKMKFLDSIISACNTISKSNSMCTMKSMAWAMLYFCQEEMVEMIVELVREEPPDQLSMAVRQQAMLAISSMSKVKLLLQEDKSSLLQVCFSSIFCLPPEEATEESVCAQTLATMDNMLKALVSSAGNFGFQELQNILELLLPFAISQTTEVQERAMAQIASLVEFISTHPLIQCSDAQQFPMLGRLVGHLTLCCTCKNQRTCEEAARALFHLHEFILAQKCRWPELDNSEQQQHLERWQERHSHQLNSYARESFKLFTKYLKPSSRANTILITIKHMTSPSDYSTSLAAYMLETLVSGSAFYPGQVQNIVEAIYRTLPSITEELACNSINRALQSLMDKHPRDVVASLLQCSPTCTHVAVAMWKVIVSEPQTAKKVLQDLLYMLRSMSRRKITVSDDPGILSLAAARMISKILPEPTFQAEAQEIFPQLFLALLCQVSFARELTRKEVQIFWVEDPEGLLSPIRSAVQVLRMLLCSVGLESQVLAIEAQGGWDALLSNQGHLLGMGIVAREMMNIEKTLLSKIFCHLAELLSVQYSDWEMVAMVFFVEMLDCSDLTEDLDCALTIFPKCLQSKCLGMPSLVLRGIFKLMAKPSMAKKTLVLLPHVAELLQDADNNAASDDSAMALSVLSNMLQTLEGTASSLTALQLAPKLRPLFDDESVIVRELSIQLFQNTMELVVGAEKKTMKQEVWDSLVPLLFRLHDQDRNVAQAAQEALCCAGQFLEWEELKKLAKTAQAWRISELLLSKEKRNYRNYVRTSQLYLKSPQEPLRREAVRFIGLIKRQTNDQKEQEYITEILEGAMNDSSDQVSSLATQTAVLPARGRLRFWFRTPRTGPPAPTPGGAKDGFLGPREGHKMGPEAVPRGWGWPRVPEEQNKPIVVWDRHHHAVPAQPRPEVSPPAPSGSAPRPL